MKDLEIERLSWIIQLVSISSLLVRGRQEGQNQNRKCGFGSSGARSQRMQAAPASGKGEETEPPLEPAEGTQPCRSMVYFF